MNLVNVVRKSIISKDETNLFHSPRSINIYIELNARIFLVN